MRVRRAIDSVIIAVKKQPYSVFETCLLNVLSQYAIPIISINGIHVLGNQITYRNIFMGKSIRIKPRYYISFGKYSFNHYISIEFDSCVTQKLLSILSLFVNGINKKFKQKLLFVWYIKKHKYMRNTRFISSI